jgi:uncharacterized protein (DUF1015 family)
MARILPFRAFRYNPHKVDLARAVTQPYDKITPEMQARYYASSEQNLTRIILGRKEQNDNPANNVYSRAAAYFRQWRQQDVLRQDSSPSVYLYRQRFRIPDSAKRASINQRPNNELERIGFIALGRIEDYSSAVVFRHEQTLAKPKADRLELLRATRGHFGQIFMLYEDAGEVDPLLKTGGNPDISVIDEYGVQHSVWQVSDPPTIQSIQTAMRDKKLIIADGHHRYETALAYRDERRQAESSSARSSLSEQAHSAPYEFVMMTFINMNSRGLVILPTHRVVHSLQSFSEENFRQSACAFFDIDEIDASIDASRATAILHESGRAGTAILAVSASRGFLLHHPNPNAPNVFAGLSLRQQDLDVVQLHKCLLEKVLHLSEESIRNQQNISYLRDAAEALAQVRGGKANIAFLMNPCQIKQVRDIAFAGEVMPQKSTDFYPKLLSGLTIYALE